MIIIDDNNNINAILIKQNFLVWNKILLLLILL